MPSKNSLRDSVREAIKDYLKSLEGASAGGLYELVLSQVECPLLEVVLCHTEGNKSKAAEYLGLNRSTLRKLLKKYDIAD